MIGALLGCMPQHWRVADLKWLAAIFAGGTPDKSEPKYWDEGLVPWLGSGEVNQKRITEPTTFITQLGYENSSAKWITSGSLVIALAGQGKTRGTVAQLEIDATCNQSLAAIVPSGIQARFLFWWLEANYANLRGLSGDDTRDGLNLELLGDVPCPVPPPAEQKELALLLDHETARIDALIEKKARFIELLHEKLQATIAHAVARGVQSDPPLRPSGSPWLGDIPSAWGCITLGKISARVVVGIAEAATQAYADEGVPILRSTNVRAGRIVGDILMIDPEFAQGRDSKSIQAGDLVTVRTGNAGVTAKVPERLDGCQCFTMLITTPRSAAEADYLCYFMNSRAAQHYFSIEGWGTAQVNISVPILKSLPIPLPPIDEQVEIVSFLHQQSARTDRLRATTERSIELLKERRAALITAAVTGQIDPRAQQPTDTALEPA